MTNDLLKLAERVEAATGPDRNLDNFIAEAVSGGRDWGAFWDRNSFGNPEAKRFTASLDAAMTLVPEHSRFGLYRCRDWGDDTCRAWVHAADHGYCEGEPNQQLIGNGQAATPALALCAASLRARAAQ